MDFSKHLIISGHKSGHNVRLTMGGFIILSYPDTKPDIVSGKVICCKNGRFIGVKTGRIRPFIGQQWPDMGKSLYESNESGHRGPICLGIIR